MLYLLYIETKGLLKQYFDSINMKKSDCLILAIFLLSITAILKMLYIFEVNINLIKLFLLLLSIMIATMDNSKLIIELFESKQYMLTKLYPIKEYKIVVLKALKYEMLKLLQFLLLIFPLNIIIILVGYNFSNILRNFIFCIIIFICFNGFVSAFKIYKSKVENIIIKILLNSILIAIPYIFIYLSSKIFLWVVNIMDGLKSINTGYNSIFTLNFIEKLMSKNNFMILIIISLFLLIIRVYAYIKISKKKKNKYYIKKKNKCSINLKNIILKKEINGLINENIFNYLINRIISYIIFAIFFYTLNQKFNVILEENLILIVLICEITLICEKICENYLGKEGNFIIQYIYSGYSILNIIKKRIFIYLFIELIYITIIEIIISIVFSIDIYGFFVNLSISILFTSVFMTICNIYNTYKSSYKNELGIPNKKMSFLKLIFETIFCYLTLPAITFIPYISSIKYKGVVTISYILILSSIYIFAIYIFANIKERDFYGEFKNAFFK